MNQEAFSQYKSHQSPSQQLLQPPFAAWSLTNCTSRNGADKDFIWYYNLHVHSLNEHYSYKVLWISVYTYSLCVRNIAAYNTLYNTEHKSNKVMCYALRKLQCIFLCTLYGCTLQKLQCICNHLLFLYFLRAHDSAASSGDESHSCNTDQLFTDPRLDLTSLVNSTRFVMFAHMSYSSSFQVVSQACRWCEGKDNATMLNPSLY